MEQTKLQHSSGEAQKNDSKDIKWSVRLMRKDDIRDCLEIWRKVELTEAYDTVVVSLLSDPEGFYVAECDDTGE